MEGKRHWDQLRTPPPTALKKIAFGPLKGKSDISPQWRYQVMTEHFGPCGTGWGFDIVDRWTEPGPEGTVSCFVTINLWYMDNDKKSDPIPANGGSMLIIKDKNGLHISDEAYKMATTDAIGNAMKKLGVAADVYLGMTDGSKYNQQPPQQQYQAPQQQPQQNQQQANDHDKAWKLYESSKATMESATANWCVDCLNNHFYQDVINHLTTGANQ